MKDRLKSTKTARTSQWKVSEQDEMEREEAAIASLLRKKKALTPKNVELEIEAQMRAEMKVNPSEFAKAKPKKKPAAKKKTASKKDTSPVPLKKLKKVVKKAPVKKLKPADTNSNIKPAPIRSTTERKKIAKRAALKARNNRYASLEAKDKREIDEQRALDRLGTVKVTKQQARLIREEKVSKANKDTKMMRKVVSKKISEKLRVKKMKKRVAHTRNPAAYH